LHLDGIRERLQEDDQDVCEIVVEVLNFNHVLPSAQSYKVLDHAVEGVSHQNNLELVDCACWIFVVGGECG